MTRYQSKRVIAADKLAAHMSGGRRRRHHAKREWGCPDDQRALQRLLESTFEVAPTLGRKLARAARAIRRAAV